MSKKPGAIIIEGHIQGLSNTRSLGETGIPVYVVDKVNCIARYSRFCTKFFKCPDFLSDEFADFLIELAISEEINGWVLLPSNDHAVLTISRNKARLSDYYKTLVQEDAVLINIYDKIKLVKIAEKNKIPVPVTYFTEQDEEFSFINFPVLTKGRAGLSFYKATGRKAFLSSDESELKSNIELISKKYPISEIFTQELVPGDHTISYTAFSINGEIKTYWMGLKLREHPRRFGTATFAVSTNIPVCHHQSVSLLKALNYTGVCEIEYLEDNRTGEYKLIEMNARTWLWVGLARACGIDYASIIYDYACSNKLYYPGNYKCDVYWINPVTDFIYSIGGILTGQLKISEYLSSLRHKSITNALFIKGDYSPGMFYILNLFRIFRNR